MQGVVGGRDLRPFLSALQCLAKTGDDLFFEADDEKVCVYHRTVCLELHLILCSDHFASFEQFPVGVPLRNFFRTGCVLCR
jgi:hypothetical protein